MDIFTLGILFVGAIGIGIFAVVMGGTLFLSLPLFQILLPDLSLAAIIGNIKFGSVLRNATALIPLYKKIDKRVLWLALVLCLGSGIGSWQIVSVSHTMVPIVLLLGLLVHEYGKKLQLPRSLYWGIVFLVGFYGGIFGAGIMLLLLALLELRQMPLVDARANALFLELLVSAVAVLTFWHFDLINWPLALVWASGGMLGGLLGGIVIKYSEQWSPTTQHWLVRAAFLIALTVAVERLA